jgi:hypothetical protein
MSAAVMMKRIAEASPRFKARMAGALFLLLVLTAACTEFFFHGRLSFAADLAAGIIELSGMVAVTLLFYPIFKPVNSNLSLLAASLNLAGLTLEALQVLNIGLVFHGLFCLLIGYLIFRSTFLPRILGALMAIAALCFLTFLSPTLANHQPPYNLACGLVGEGLVMLWLLVMGVNAQRWREQASAAGERRS